MVSNDSDSSGAQSTTKKNTSTGGGTAAARRNSATATNLEGALRALSGHVNDRKLEKMATNFTRLVSLLQKDKADGHKLVKLLGDIADGSGGDDEGGDDLSSMSPIVNSEIRDALVHVFKQLGKRERMKDRITDGLKH